MELFSPPREKANPEKILIFSRKKALLMFPETENSKNSLYFKKRNFLIFQERYIPNPWTFRNLYSRS